MSRYRPRVYTDPEPTVWGLMLSMAKKTMLTDTLTAEEREEKLRAHEERVAREQAELAAGLERAGREARDAMAQARVNGRRKRETILRKPRHVHLPLGKKWHMLKMCNCRTCQTELLGESDECVRQAAAPGRKTSIGVYRQAMTCYHRLPPPVAFRDERGPLCSKCHERESRAGAHSQAG